MKSIRTLVCLGFLVLLSSLTKPVFGQLKAQFTSNIQSGCSPLIVAFQDQSQGTPVSWKWNLGNGSQSANQNPITTYSNPGTYSVTLTVTNSAGQTAVSEKYSITVYQNPVALFAATPTIGCFPLNVNYTSGSLPGSGLITDYLWDFGDGNISAGQKVSHVYTSPGTFDITLKVTNTYGCTNTLTKSDLIHIDNGVNAGFALTSIDVCKSPAVANFSNTSNGSGTLSYLWNYGDGSSGTSTTHSYAKSGTYNVILTAQSSGGCSDTAAQTVSVAIPSTSFTNTEATCTNQKISFTNTSTPAPVSSTWYFSDGSTSTQSNPEKIFTKTGTYIVKLVNSFSETCKDSTAKTITVASGPAVSFKADDTSRCEAPLLVNFKNTTTGTATYAWDFGDNQKSVETNPAHTYTNTGSFSVTLTATNANGCQNSLQKVNYINIQPIKINRLLNLPDSGCAPLIIAPTIELNINTKIKTYKWDFGDGGTSDAATPSHTYTKEGFFNVTVTIVTEDGCTATYTYKNAALVGHKPHANFSTNFDTVCANTGVYFYDQSTGGPITFLQWNYGQIKDSASNHSYYFIPTDTGYFKISLVAYNYGCADTLEKEHALYALAPVARINYKLNCDNKTLVNFTDTSTADASHTWDFGDGQTSTAKKVAHTYAAPGTYTVNLYAANKTCRDTATSTVRVIDEKGEMFLDKSIYCRGNLMSGDISGINESNVNSTTWDFGDGVIRTVNGATQQNHVYVTTGKFTITATMTDLNNCQYNYRTKDSITVYGPLSKFISAKPGICQGSAVAFADQSVTDGIHPIVQWAWDYGDTVTHTYSTPQSFSYSYADTGNFNIKQTVTDTYGCSDSEYKPKYVYVTHPYAAFKMSDSVVCAGGAVLFNNTSNASAFSSVWDLGDGNNSTKKSTSNNYVKDGTYYPVLTVTDINGCVSSTSQKVIASSPIARFNLSDSFSTCPPLQVNFQNISDYYTSYAWDFGDGSTSLIDTPSHLYNFPGIYHVKLSLKGHGSCVDTLTKNITIKGPSGKIKYDIKPLCAPGIVQFSAIANDTKTFTWDFSDGNTIITSGNVASHTYDSGYYVPKLILTDDFGCKVSVPGHDTIRVYTVKAYAIVGNPTGCDSALVQFTDASQSNDKIVKRTWYFGDNDSAVAKDGSHMYATVGTYKPKLITVTNTGCTDTLNIIAPVVISPAPKIKINGDAAACAATNVSFAAANSTADTSAITWTWNLNNGASASGQSVSTSYNSGGNYTVSLKGTYSTGCSDSTSAKIKINNAPAVKAMPDSTVCKGGIFKLSVSGALSYTWQGTGLDCKTCQYPTAKIDTSSTFVVTGVDEIGCTASDTTAIKTIAPLPMNVSGDDTVCVGETVQFAAAGVKTYQWYPAVYLDNDKTDKPVFRPMADTSIRYRVIGFGEQNCFADTAYVNAKAFAIPHVNIQNNQDEIVLGSGESVRLFSNSSSDITQWRWSPSAGLDNPGVANPMATPRQTTTYSVVASNGGGCVSRDEITVRVVCKNTNVFIPNTFSPNNDGMNDIFYPRGTGLFNIKSFRVFNRWGQVMFERFNVVPNNAGDGWNGMYNGKPLQSDVYVYMMEVVCENGITIPVKGNVTLLR